MSLVSHTALKGVLAGGLVPEDVMSKIWDISKIPLPFSDLIGSADSHKNEFCEWTQDKLGAPDTANAVLDGADASTDNNALGKRVGNHSQISDKVVSASSRARDGSTIGQGDPYSYQIMMRQQELRRDIEAICLLNQASRADNGTDAGLSGGFDAWLASNTSNGATGGDGGFNTGTRLVVAATPGTPRALSETTIRDVCQQVYEAGGNPSVLMGRPTVIRKLSAYMFSSSAQIATLSSDVAEKRTAAVATGSVNVFVTDFGIVLEMVANRLQPTTASGVSSVFIIDPQYVTQSYLQRINVAELAKTGLSTKGQMYADWSLKVLNEEAHGVIRAIDETAAVVA
jgi:Family of unknown function (DUF5309)